MVEINHYDISIWLIQINARTFGHSTNTKCLLVHALGPEHTVETHWRISHINFLPGEREIIKQIKYIGILYSVENGVQR